MGQIWDPFHYILFLFPPAVAMTLETSEQAAEPDVTEPALPTVDTAEESETDGLVSTWLSTVDNAGTFTFASSGVRIVGFQPNVGQINPKWDKCRIF